MNTQEEIYPYAPKSIRERIEHIHNALRGLSISHTLLAEDGKVPPQSDMLLVKEYQQYLSECEPVRPKRLVWQ